MTTPRPTRSTRSPFDARTTSRLARVAITALVAGVLAAGCDAEKKITPPDPPSPYLEPSSPLNVLKNLEYAYEHEDSTAYAAVFTEDFTFVFNPDDVRNPDNPTPAEWDLEDELQAAGAMFRSPSVDDISLNWSIGEPDSSGAQNPQDPDTLAVRVDEINLDVITKRDDTIWIYKVQGATHWFHFLADRSVTYAGDKHRWRVYRWLDSPIGAGKTEEMTWGHIKMLFGR